MSPEPDLDANKKPSVTIPTVSRPFRFYRVLHRVSREIVWLIIMNTDRPDDRSRECFGRQNRLRKRHYKIGNGLSANIDKKQYVDRAPLSSNWNFFCRKKIIISWTTIICRQKTSVSNRSTDVGGVFKNKNISAISVATKIFSISYVRKRGKWLWHYPLRPFVRKLLWIVKPNTGFFFICYFLNTFFGRYTPSKPPTRFAYSYDGFFPVHTSSCLRGIGVTNDVRRSSGHGRFGRPNETALKHPNGPRARKRS